MTHGGQGPVNEKFLGAAFFQKGPEKNKKDHVSGQDIGHDAEHTVAFIKDTGTQFGERIPSMGNDFRKVIPVYTVCEHQETDNHKNIAHHPPGQFNADENPDHRNGHVKWCFSSGPVVDGFKIKHPVPDGNDGEQDQQVTHPMTARLLL